MKKIETILANLKNIEVNNIYKENSKRRILSYIKNEQNEFFTLKLLKNIFKPNAWKYLRQVVRERILIIAKKKKMRIFNKIFDFFNLSWIKLIWSTVTASFFVVFVIWINNTSATVQSKVVLIEWIAEIQHLWEKWEVIKNSEILWVWDKIRTLDNSLVEIYFYDNSVTRLSNNSQISISSLTTNPLELKPTVLKLINWRIWNQVITWENQFSIETKNTSITTKEWIFDITENWETNINVISKPIKVKALWSKDEYSKISAWYWIKSDENWIQTTKIIKDDNWTRKNKIADKRHREKLVSEITEKTLKEIKILPSNINYFDKISSNKETNLSIAKKRIQELKILNLNNNSSLINENKKIIKELIADLEIYEKLELSDFLSSEIQKLKIVIPWDELYEYKIFISQVAQSIDPDKIYTKSIVNERLYEAHEVANTIKDKSKLITALNNFNSFRDTLWTWKISVDEKVLKEELINKNDQLFLLQSIENTLEKEKDLKEAVSKEKQKIAKEIRIILIAISKDETTWVNLENSKSTKIFAETINLLTQKINKYSTLNWKKNTLHWILQEIPNDKINLDLLYSFRAQLDWELSFMVSKKIVEIKRWK